MPEKILLAQPENGLSQPLYELLRTEGYFVLKAATVSQAVGMMRESPALLLFDRYLVDQEGVDGWKTLGDACKKGDIRCLQIAPSAEEQGWNTPPDSWVSGTIRLPADAEEVIAKIESQLTIRRLSYELALVHAKLKEKQVEVRENNRSAAQIQRSLLPSRFPQVDSFRFAWRFIPWEQVGGDLFNVFQLDENTVMAYLFDVSGHGIPSAMVTVSIYQSLSLHTGNIIKKPLDAPPFYEILSPAKVLRELDLEYPFERFSKFFTISYLLLDSATGTVRYSNAGHPPPILMRGSGTSEYLSAGGPIIGMGGPVPFDEGQVTLAPGDRLYLYSDGITEYRDITGELFGVQRLVDKLARLGRRPLDTACGKVIEALNAFGKGSTQKDDMTLLAIEYCGR